MECQTEYWDRVAEQWGGDSPHRLWRQHSDAVNRQLLERWLTGPPVEALLKTDLFDEATAEGLVPLLATKARHVVGIDISTGVLAAAKRRLAALEAIRADVRALPFGEESFDAVVSLSTLDHFESLADVAAGLRELRRVLRPGASLILTLDNPANPFVRLRNALPFALLNRCGLVPFYPGATCGPRRLRRLVKQAGFEIREATAILHCPRVAAVLLCRWIGHGTAAARRRAGWLRFLEGFERLGRLPTRFITGHFIALRAARLGP